MLTIFIDIDYYSQYPVEVVRVSGTRGALSTGTPAAAAETESEETVSLTREETDDYVCT